MTDTPMIFGTSAPTLTADEQAAKQAADARAAADAKAADEVKKIADAQTAKDKAEADALKAKQKTGHILRVVGAKPPKGISNSTSNAGTPIPRAGPLTIVLISTTNPSGTGSHPGTDIGCIATLPDKSEIGDLVEAYAVPGEHGGSAFVHPPKGESIGVLPVSTGDNIGTGVEVPVFAGRLFRKISAAAWQVIGA